MSSVISEITDDVKVERSQFIEDRVRALVRQPVTKRAVAVLFPGLMILLSSNLPGWVWMWVMALALFLGAKWLTVVDLVASGKRASASKFFAYLLGWPGMDARRFLDGKPVARPQIPEWALAGTKMVCGAGLVWGIAPHIPTNLPLLKGWIGMIGLVMLLHFGIFDLLSAFWRSFGFDAKPIMRGPAAATSLSEFWGERWNRAFSDSVERHCFRPLARRISPRAALMVTFFVSGLLHELVISLPAGGGYGWPTAYFVIQGLGVLFERADAGKRMGLGNGCRGWAFVVLVAGAPAFWLFHPLFVRNVILPMLAPFGAR